MNDVLQKNGRQPKKNKKWKMTKQKMENEPINQNQPNRL